MTVGYIVAPFLLLVLSVVIIAIILCFCRKIVKEHNAKAQDFPTHETINPNFYQPVRNKLSSNFTKNNRNEPGDLSNTHKEEWFV